MKKKFKIGLLVVVIVVVISFIPTKTETVGKSKIEETTKIEADYTVTDVEDVSFGKVKRYSLSIITKTLDTEQIKLIGTEAIEQLKKEKPFNAVTVIINDHEEFEGQGYALAKMTYAPYGDWSKAMDVSTGDYRKMKYEFDIKEKNPDNQLTDFEAKIIKEWYDLLYSQPSDSIDEQIVTNLVANNNDITSEQVDDIFNKFVIWMY